MGNDTPKAINSEINEHSHPVLRSAKLINHKQQIQLELVLPVAGQHIYKKWEEQIKDYKSCLDQTQSLLLPISIQYTKSGMCGSEGSIKAKYKYPPFLLTDEIQNRIEIMQPFEETEVWYILYRICEVATKLHNKNMVIGDIRPKNIFLFPQGQIALNCKATFLDQQTNYIKSLETKQKTFLAPQQLQDLQKKKTKSIMPELSENFSTGMTLMNIMLLHDEQKLYFYQHMGQYSCFDQHQFQKQLSYLVNCQNYSLILRRLVFSLLIDEPTSRITSQEIINILGPYKQKIQNLHSFSIDQNKILTLTAHKLYRTKLESYSQQSFGLKNKSQITRVSGTFPNNIKKDSKMPSLIIHNGPQFNYVLSSQYDSQANNLQMKSNNHKYTPQTNYERTFLASSPGDHRYDYKNEKVDQRLKPQINLQNETQNHTITIFNDQKFNQSISMIQPYQKQHETYELVQSKISYDNKDKDSALASFVQALPSITYNHSSNRKPAKKQITKFYTQDQSRKNSYDSDMHKLSEMGRQAKSIRTPMEYKSNQNASFQKMMKEVDEQLATSRQKFF